MTDARHKSDRQTKVDWLLKHRHLWSGWPLGDLGSDPRHHVIVDAMKADGLYSPWTYWCDVNLQALIVEARRRRRSARYGG